MDAEMPGKLAEIMGIRPLAARLLRAASVRG
jgi:hypothetical protein